ncbi:energy transducer TonB [Natronohydrobacter thiooxidans]|uniref:energy transducer TonB n=1 Tax=Natronohydrobacter thiooxidans TaxID=87172 RepID=UPI0009FE346E|nr:TonB family protein [Natronohydrobacter thiooxidans]
MTATALLRACPQRNGCPLVSPRDLRRLDLAPRVKTLALAAGASVLLHLGAMAALAPREMALIAGGGEAAPAALGTSFADFAEGVLSPSEAEPLEVEHADTILPVAPAQAQTPHPAQPDRAALAVPLAPDQNAALLPAMPEQVTTTTPPEQMPETPAAPITAPAELAQTPPPEILAAAPSETVNPDTSPSELAPTTSRTPPPRPDRTQPTRQARAPQGNAAQSATRGGQQGSTGQTASEAPVRTQASAQGNAAASNYPGEVLRRIQRTRQARSPARGQVLVAFSVASNGGLASVSVARSSGHAGLDQAALDHIRRAAPFPPPPGGAQRQFSFEFVGR